MPFYDANLEHVGRNTVPLFVLLILLAELQPCQWEVVVSIALFGGLLLWIFGHKATHLGASGLILAWRRS